MHTLHLQIGPGPYQYVLREFIRMLVNCHRNPPAALRMMAELDSNTSPVAETTSAAPDSSAVASSSSNATADNSSELFSSRREKLRLGMQCREKVMVKAKLKPRSETRAVPIVSNIQYVPDFVRQICILFQACPGLYTTEKRLPDAECKESCDSFVRPNPRAVAYRRAPRRQAIGGQPTTTPSGAVNNYNGGPNSRGRRLRLLDSKADDVDEIVPENEAADGGDADGDGSQPQVEQPQQQPEAPVTRSTRNRAKVSYQLMDKGTAGDF